MIEEKMIAKVKIEIDGKVYFECEVLKDNIFIEQKAGVYRMTNSLTATKEMKHNGNVEFELKIRKGMGKIGDPLDTGINLIQ